MYILKFIYHSGGQDIFYSWNIYYTVLLFLLSYLGSCYKYSGIYYTPFAAKNYACVYFKNDTGFFKLSVLHSFGRSGIIPKYGFIDYLF